MVFEELHKFRQWRRYLKGLYDAKDPALLILVTGSARLDLYRYGGDSLQERYHPTVNVALKIKRSNHSR